MAESIKIELLTIIDNIHPAQKRNIIISTDMRTNDSESSVSIFAPQNILSIYFHVMFNIFPELYIIYTL